MRCLYTGEVMEKGAQCLCKRVPPKKNHLPSHPTVPPCRKMGPKNEFYSFLVLSLLGVPTQGDAPCDGGTTTGPRSPGATKNRHFHGKKGAESFRTHPELGGDSGTRVPALRLEPLTPHLPPSQEPSGPKNALLSPGRRSGGKFSSRNRPHPCKAETPMLLLGFNPTLDRLSAAGRWDSVSPDPR